MSKMSEHLIEEQETGRSLPLVPSTPERHDEPEKPSDNTIYWQLCLKVVEAAGELAAKDKLLMNFRDPSNSHKVKHVIDKSFAGEVANLRDARADWIWEFFRSVDEVNWFARKHSLAQVSAMSLMGLLESADVRKAFRKHIRAHVESDHPAFELDLLPGKDFTTAEKQHLPYRL